MPSKSGVRARNPTKIDFEQRNLKPAGDSPAGQIFPKGGRVFTLPPFLLGIYLVSASHKSALYEKVVWGQTVGDLQIFIPNRSQTHRNTRKTGC